MNTFMSIFAGVLIGLGGTANLIIGGLPGAICFSIGLYAIILFKCNLVTGKLSTIGLNGFSILDYPLCYCGNALGALLTGGLTATMPKYIAMQETAQCIMSIRMSNSFSSNLVLGMFCGICVFIAVAGYVYNSHPITVMLPVAVFVYCGFNHCVADMFYMTVAQKLFDTEALLALLATTLGNILGCGLPAMIRLTRTKNTG